MLWMDVSVRERSHGVLRSCPRTAVPAWAVCRGVVHGGVHGGCSCGLGMPTLVCASWRDGAGSVPFSSLGLFPGKRNVAGGSLPARPSPQRSTAPWGLPRCRAHSPQAAWSLAEAMAPRLAEVMERREEKPTAQRLTLPSRAACHLPTAVPLSVLHPMEKGGVGAPFPTCLQPLPAAPHLFFPPRTCPRRSSPGSPAPGMQQLWE